MGKAADFDPGPANLAGRVFHRALRVGGSGTPSQVCPSGGGVLLGMFLAFVFTGEISGLLAGPQTLCCSQISHRAPTGTLIAALVLEGLHFRGPFLQSFVWTLFGEPCEMFERHWSLGHA